MRLKDKTALVTGASRGIGRAIALTFAKEGADIIVNYAKNADRAIETKNEIMTMGRKVIALQADVANKEEVFRMVDYAIKEFGKIDILVNNAGIAWKPTMILKGTPEEWQRVLGVNLVGTYYCVQAVAPHMIERRYGKIVNITSLASIGTTFGEQVAYGPSKAAVNLLTKRLAYELGPNGINVNAIAPGLIKTEILNVGRTEGEVKKILRDLANAAALRRTGNPEDIANAALFLASDEASVVTGHLLVVDGGRFNLLSHSI